VVKRRRVIESDKTPKPAFIPTANRLLAALSPDELRRLSSSLDVIPLPLKKTLYKPGDVVEHVYFPGGGFCSVLTVLANGEMVEVATVGREGMVGLSAIVVDNPETALTMVQAEHDRCYRMKAITFRRLMDQGGAFHDIVTLFVQAQISMVMQFTACNASHTVEQRLARWLLMAHDRIGKDEFPLTQEFVAMMLGAARPTVTIVAGILQRAGLITYRRGRIAIRNRQGLEKASCECYRVTNDVLGRVAQPRASRRA
jgi:CRP-like cAMP-binding protein